MYAIYLIFLLSVGQVYSSPNQRYDRCKTINQIKDIDGKIKDCRQEEVTVVFKIKHCCLQFFNSLCGVGARSRPDGFISKMHPGSICCKDPQMSVKLLSSISILFHPLLSFPSFMLSRYFSLLPSALSFLFYVAVIFQLSLYDLS